MYILRIEFFQHLKTVINFLYKYGTGATLSIFANRLIVIVNWLFCKIPRFHWDCRGTVFQLCELGFDFWGNVFWSSHMSFFRMLSCQIWVTLQTGNNCFIQSGPEKFQWLFNSKLVFLLGEGFDFRKVMRKGFNSEPAPWTVLVSLTYIQCRLKKWQQRTCGSNPYIRKWVCCVLSLLQKFLKVLESSS